MTSDPGATSEPTVSHTPEAHHAAKPTTSAPTAPKAVKQSAVRRTRAATVWTGVILGLLLLILLLVFIVQNMVTVDVTFLGWQIHHVPLGITVLISAVAGGLLTALVGIVRIVQLRRAAKKNLLA